MIRFFIVIIGIELGVCLVILVGVFFLNGYNCVFFEISILKNKINFLN